MKKLGEIFQLLQSQKSRYLLALLTIGTATLFAYTAPLVIRTTIDSLLGQEPLDGQRFIDGIFLALGGADVLRNRLYIPAILLVALVSVQGVLTFTSRTLAATAAERSMKELRDSLLESIQRREFAYFGNVSTGDLIQRCTSDVDTVRRFVQTQFVEIGNTLIMLVIALSLMFSLNPGLALLTLPVIPLTFLFSFVFFKNVQRVFTLSDESEGRLSSMLSEHLTGIRVVKAFGREAFEIGRFDEHNRDYRDTTTKLVNLLAMYWGTTSFLSMFQVVLVLSVGSYWAVQGSVTLGTLQVFISYVWMILWPIRQMGRILVDMGKAFVSVSRINEVRSGHFEDVHETASVEPQDGAIEFLDVSFGYPRVGDLGIPGVSESVSRENDAGNENSIIRRSAAIPGSAVDDGHGGEVLRNISFSIAAGETVGILGPTGSGKSTLLHLMAGLYDNYQGSIRVGGHDIREMNLEVLRRKAGYVLQEPFLFTGSIRKNIRMGREEAIMDDVQRVAQDAEMHGVISGFEAGYHTMVGERGITLSGGQRQRLAITRALVRDALIYMFDDSLSALDAETDARIRNNLMKREKRATVLIVSHRLSTVAGADRILVLEHGRISQMGSHEQLVSQPGLYRRLWDLQGGSSFQQEDAALNGDVSPNEGNISREIDGISR